MNSISTCDMVTVGLDGFWVIFMIMGRVDEWKKMGF